MNKMQSIHIRVPSPMEKWLDSKSKETGIPKAEIIRLGINLLMDKERRRK